LAVAGLALTAGLVAGTRSGAAGEGKGDGGAAVGATLAPLVGKDVLFESNMSLLGADGATAPGVATGAALDGAVVALVGVVFTGALPCRHIKSAPNASAPAPVNHSRRGFLPGAEVAGGAVVSASGGVTTAGLGGSGVTTVGLVWRGVTTVGLLWRGVTTVRWSSSTSSGTAAGGMTEGVGADCAEGAFAGGVGGAAVAVLAASGAGAGAGAGRGADRRVATVVVVSSHRNSALNSSMLAGRSAGLTAKPASTASSQCSGRRPAKLVRGRGMPSRIMRLTAVGGGPPANVKCTTRKCQSTGLALIRRRRTAQSAHSPV
jgi:hypothetical protein